MSKRNPRQLSILLFSISVLCSIACATDIASLDPVGAPSVILVAPRILRVEPTTAAPGDTIVIIAENLVPGQTTITFGVGTGNEITVLANQVRIEGQRLTVTVPSGAVTGPLRITNTSTGESTTTPFNFTVLGGGIPQTITLGTTQGFAANPAVDFAGDPVILTGTNLLQTQQVIFSNGIRAPFTINSSTQITATIPQNAVTGPIQVVTSTGTATSSVFTVLEAPPVLITGLQNTRRPRVRPGQRVTLQGQGFQPAGQTNRTTVLFDGSIVTPVEVLSDTTLSFQIPNNAGAFTRVIEVRTPGGGDSLTVIVRLR
jgi:hypothetical protein